MCGITGFFTPHEPASRDVASSMASRIAHRGPDGVGVWADDVSGVALAHRRLAVIDLSLAGAQPMVSAGGRYVIVFNGEIYNHQRIREDLQKGNLLLAAWRGLSDTETLLAAFEAWGIESTLQRTMGMFAIAVWDRQNRQLILMRDRFGEKPLYYGWQKQGAATAFLFGSELSALQAHPAFAAEISRDALAYLLRQNYIGDSRSIYVDIHKLLPGHMLILSTEHSVVEIKEWWNRSRVAEYGVSHRFEGTANEAVSTLDVLLRDSVSQQMVADVPLGAFLSGGVDSSTIVALMQAQSNKPVKTFSIGFHEKCFNEAEYAKSVANYLGTEHTELYVDSEHATAVIQKLPALYSEPFGDSSQIPTFLVSQLARQNVTAALSGDAGDELFCGYSRYLLTAALWHKLAVAPVSVRRFIARLISNVSPSAWNRLGSRLLIPRLGERLHKGAGLLDSCSIDDLYKGMVSQWPKPEGVVVGARKPADILVGATSYLDGMNDQERMMALDMLGYLPDDILVKVDRAGMGVGLETRVPFLDHRVVEFAWSLPLDFKLRRQSGRFVSKWALREVLYRYVPKSFIERPKMGFGVPLDQWLRGPLRGWAEALLDETRLKAEGYFEAQPIRQKWLEHLSGRRNWQHQLWGVLMFQAWLEHQKQAQ